MIRILAVCFSLFLVACGQVPSQGRIDQPISSTNFPDTLSHDAYPEIEWLRQGAYVSGYCSAGICNFQPDTKVTRAEFAAMLDRAFRLYNSVSNRAMQQVVVSDIKDARWANDAIRRVVKKGYMSGYRKVTNLAGVTSVMFKPASLISFQEAVTSIKKHLPCQLNRVDQFEDGDMTQDWAVRAMSRALNIMGKNTRIQRVFKYSRGNSTEPAGYRVAPYTKITRAQIAVFLRYAIKDGFPAPVCPAPQEL